MRNLSEILIPRTRPEGPWNHPLPLYDQLRQGVGIGALQRESDLDKLRGTFDKGIRPRFSPDDQTKLLGTFDLAMELHAPLPRRRTGAPAAVHPAHVGIINLRDRTVHPLNTAIRLLHDTIEDGATTKEALPDQLRERGWTQTESDIIVAGVDAFSMKQGGKKLPAAEYKAQLIAAHTAPELRGVKLISIKPDDRATNSRDDSTRMMDATEDTSPVNYTAIEVYLDGKATQALLLGEAYARRSPSVGRLREAMDVNRRLLAEHSEPIVVYKKAA